MSSSLELQPGAPESARMPSAADPAEARFARLRRTVTFRGEKLLRWLRARVFLIGGGNLGGRVALEAVRSGARVVVCDRDVGTETNLGTQCVQPGVGKALSIAAACDALAPGSAQAIQADVRSVGIGTLRACDVLLDCSDDAMLAWPLTELSNGLGIPLVRLALDGSGRSEVGRVLTSAGGTGHACQLCTYGSADLARPSPATPCPGSVAVEPQATIAGGALGMAIAGLGLLQAQRLVTGNDLEYVLDRELLLDLSHSQLLATRLRRSDACLSRHEGPWHLVPAGLTTEEATVADVFARCAGQLGTTDLLLEPYGHPLGLQVSCACGARRLAVGSVWSVGPACPRCGQAMQWTQDIQWPRLSSAQARELGIHTRTLAELGLPQDGALLIARAPGRPALRLLFQSPLAAGELPLRRAP